MEFSKSRAAGALSFALGALLAVAAHAAPPLDAYGRLPTIEDVRLSPDGQRLAYVGATQDSRVISIISLGEKAEPILLKGGPAKLRDLGWADNTHLIVTSSVTSPPPLGVRTVTREYLQAFLYDTVHRTTVLIQPPREMTAINAVLAPPAVRAVGGRKVLFFKSSTPREHQGVPTLFSMDVITGVVHLIDQGSLTERNYMIGVSGGEIAQGFFDNGRWTIKVKTDAGWRATTLDAKIDVPQFEGLGPHGDTVVIGNSPDADGAQSWRQISLKDGAWLSSDLPGEVVRDPQTGLAIASRVETDHAAYQFFDAALQKRWDAILKAFPGEQVDFVSTSDDRSKFVVRVFGANTGAAFMLVDLTTGQGELIGDLYKEAPPAEVALTTFITYAAADGLKIPAYLTLPKGRDAKSLPLIVLPHDGVGSRDTLAFNWWVQALASRGYAVLQPQFRGSKDFGDDFREQGFGQWGRKMQTDLSDGVGFLAAQGVIDPRRVCIVGQGYGGYAALAGAALQSGVYRCAVSVGGISDPKQMLDWIRGRTGGFYTPAVPFFERYMGAESQKDASLAEISPLTQAAKVNIPVLLIHGRDDTVVPFEQSQAMADVLKTAKIPAQLVALRAEDHWLSRADTRQQMLQATVQFLEANNPPDAAKTAVAAQ